MARAGNWSKSITTWLTSVLQESGKEIDAAMRDGSWSYLDDIENLIIPDDLATALQKNKTAKGEFDAFDKCGKKVILL